MPRFTASLLFLILSVLGPQLASAQAGGWLGVGLTEIEEGEAQALGYEHSLVAVSRVFPLSPAEGAGLSEGDIVLRFADDELSVPADLVSRVGASPSGSEIHLSILREGATIDAAITLAPRPDFNELTRQYLHGNPARPLHANLLADDSALELAALSGQVVLLDFWSTTCGPCLASIPHLNALQAQYGEQGFHIVGVSADPADVTQPVANRMAIEYTVAIDVEERSQRDYFITAFPTLVLIDRTGNVHDVIIGAGDLDALSASIEALVAM